MLIFIKLPHKLRNNCADVFYNIIVGRSDDKKDIVAIAPKSRYNIEEITAAGGLYESR